MGSNAGTAWIQGSQRQLLDSNMTKRNRGHLVASVFLLEWLLGGSQMSRPPRIVITPTTTLIPIPIAIAVQYRAFVVAR